MSKTFTDDQIIDAVYRQGGYKPASRYLGMPESTLRARHRKATEKTGDASRDERLDIDEKDESCSLSYKGGNLRTVDDVLKFANVDMRFWDIDRKVISKWEVALKIHPGEDVKSGTDGKSHKVRGADSVETRDLFQIKMWLKRKARNLVTDGLELFNEWASSYRPAYKPVKRQKISDPHMLEISIADAHFGKLAWDKETGCDYDTEIANRIYREAFHDLLAKVQAYPIEEIVVPIGNDLFHIDNRIGSTEKGTMLDYDGRYPKIVGKVQQAIVEAVDSATSVAKVKLLFVPGNHDRTVSWHLMQYLSAWYRDNADVDVDMSPRYRKYVRYGVNLIGFTHGD